MGSLAGCSSAPPRVDSSAGVPVPADAVRTQAVFTAMQMVGVPYQWGGASPQGFDCSGLVQYAYSNAGLWLPRTAADQMKAVTPVTLENAEAGDLLFFREGKRTSHVAIYLGQGRFVHAPSTGSSVSLDSFSNTYWRMRFARAGRVQPAG
jgi:murein DD-endopeptidase